ncbi:MAG: hypothetical protein ACK41P_01635 [Asticcacaulis sp.]
MKDIGFLTALLTGLGIGFVAQMMIQGRSPVFVTLVVSMIGAVLGSFIALSLALPYQTLGDMILSAAIGAVVVTTGYVLSRRS